MSDAVGTAKVYEDERVIVWELGLAPGESTPVHTHRHDYVFYVLEGATLEVLDGAGRFLHRNEAKAGAAFAFRLEGDNLVSTDGRGMRLPATHAARNAGTTRFREILIETKR
jgi:redox-sensitive bicupin YhaK (pirin superfamily)